MFVVLALDLTDIQFDCLSVDTCAKSGDKCLNIERTKTSQKAECSN